MNCIHRFDRWAVSVSGSEVYVAHVCRDCRWRIELVRDVDADDLERCRAAVDGEMVGPFRLHGNLPTMQIGLWDGVA